MIGLKLDAECPRCKGILYWDDDSYEKYLTCLACAHEWNRDLTPRRLTPDEFYKRYGINCKGLKRD